MHKALIYHNDNIKVSGHAFNVPLLLSSAHIPSRDTSVKAWVHLDKAEGSTDTLAFPWWPQENIIVDALRDGQTNRWHGYG